MNQETIHLAHRRGWRPFCDARRAITVKPSEVKSWPHICDKCAAVWNARLEKKMAAYNPDSLEG